ncbi:class I SAM-dependent methyltransferase [Flavobacterium crassostreae]|uniref:SAM-dependent methyltransferase n=1 Tax=Flavobacterium crassostreae TaxID=1763534 RepID=A0A1B9DYW1_9FLAO|nr:SAM-dependent methyltransferase [Flavobacterium crassostreae]OCB74883.1 SAM-dependent methyltransferase [Flavobacterium crassostreae]
MESKLLSNEVQNFITENIPTSVAKLALQKNPFPDIEWSTILKQIEAKAKAKQKLPSWFATDKIIYPSKISIEQTSSESTAKYKSSLISGKNLIDLTGGFGVDDYYFSKKMNTIAHCEINPELAAIVKHNFTKLQANNIICYTGDSATTLSSLNTKWDWIYIDPSRRNDAKGKVFMLQDCLPNVPENLNFYFKYSTSILVKTAPLLDITAGLTELNNVKTIHIIALDNEVKELLWELHKDYSGNTTIATVNLTKDKLEHFSFIMQAPIGNAKYSLPQKYLYEPNSAIMKSGGFDAVSQFYNIKKLHKHSHLYTSDSILDFPGRVFDIQTTFTYSKAPMQTYLKNTKSNVTTRNFPETVEKIRKKWDIKDGGTLYTFFTTDINNNKIVLICNKIK